LGASGRFATVHDPVNSTAVIFDLDDTLLDSSALRYARDRRDWRTVYGGLDRVVAFTTRHRGEIAVTSLPQAARKRGLKVGILTHSPDRYAGELLRAHGIRVDAMVTGSDGYPPKPDPAGLRAVAAALGIAPRECLYVGDSVGDFGAAAAAGMYSVGVAWSGDAPPDWRHGWPDVAIDRPSHLLRLIGGNTQLGPLGEVLTNGEEPSVHWGSLLRLGAATYGLGRYFSTEDCRHPTHALSHLVLASKDREQASERLASIFETAARLLPVTRTPQRIVSVPPAPGDERDRFAAARAEMAAVYGALDGGDALRMRYPVEDYKRTHRTARAAKNTDRFAATHLSGERTLLIDDVLTSGGQVKACRAALRAAGCGPVTVMVLTVTQDKLPEPCPACGSNLTTRRRRSDGREFLGCSNWPNCSYSRSLPASVGAGKLT
jgi:HAD superfamily hydrolase (TIGR01509 family)